MSSAPERNQDAELSTKPGPEGGDWPLRCLADAAPQALLLHDGRAITLINRAMTEALGYEAKEAAGREVTSLFAEEMRADVEARLRSTDRQTFEAMVLRKDGSMLHVEAVTSHFSVNGRDSYIYGLSLADISERKRIEEELRDAEARFDVITNISSDGLALSESGAVMYVNPSFCKIMGRSREEIEKLGPLALTAPESHEITIRNLKNNVEEAYEVVGLRPDGTKFPLMISGKRMPYRGRIVRGTLFRDLSAQRNAEEALRQNAVQEEQLRAQATRLAELSTPVIPISDDILVLPLIGTIDSARADRVMETMLEGISRARAKTAIIDITGVTGIDTQAADALLKVARAARLLGAEVILTGIRPEVAQTLVVLGADLSSVISKGTLQAGIVHAMDQRSR